MKDISIRIIKHGSEEHKNSLVLRNDVLRKPLGMKFDIEKLYKKEKDQIHIGIFFKEKIIGCLLIRKDSEEVAQIRQVAVSNKLQGQGIGAKLMHWAEEHAKQNGFTSIFLHARETVVPFYKKLGYQEEGEPFIEIGISHINMVKIL